MMKLLHWIACHSVSVVLLFFLVVAFVFREPLFGIIPEIPAAESPQAMKSETDEDLSPLIPEKLTTPSTDIPTESLVTAMEPAVVKPETAAQIQERKKFEFRPADELPVQETVNEDLLQKARKAYWNDELDSARLLYLAYIDLNPESPDGYGELGNLLSTLGDLDEAAISYSRAAELLMTQGEEEQAAQLHQVLDSIKVIQATAE